MSTWFMFYCSSKSVKNDVFDPLLSIPIEPVQEEIELEPVKPQTETNRKKRKRVISDEKRLEYNANRRERRKLSKQNKQNNPE